MTVSKTVDESLQLMEMEEEPIEGAPHALVPVANNKPNYRSPSPSRETTSCATPAKAQSKGRDGVEGKRFLCILGVAKLNRTACSAGCRCDGGTIRPPENEESRERCKTCGEGARCSNAYEEFAGLAFRVVGIGIETEDYGTFGEAIGRAQDEGYVSRERGVERLLLRTCTHSSQKVILVLSKSPSEESPPSPGGESTSSSSSAVTTGEIMSEVLHSAYVSISKFLDGVRDGEREFAAITVTSSSAFNVVLPMDLRGPPRIQLHEADAQVRSFGFWKREPAVEAFLSLLPLDNGHKIVHVFSKLASKEGQRK